MLIESLFAVAIAAGAQPPPDMPTTIERGLIDRACHDAAPDAADQCRDEKLTALRADFGKDLTKVKVDDRKRVDATCSPLLADSALKGRDPYFTCMLEQLTALRPKKKNANAAAAGAAPSDTPAETPEAPAAPPPASGMAISTIVAAGLGVVALGGIALVVMRSRGPKAGKCSTCGGVVPAGDESELCPKCKKELAESLRKIKADQAEQARQAADEAKRDAEALAKRRELQRLREAEERKVREYDEQRERAHAEKVAEAMKPNEPADEPPNPYDAVTFDPHAILGVKPDATTDAITAAYQAAKKKYDPDLVVHLSEEVQAHYREKAEAVEKAFQTLTGGSQPA